jgi:UDP-N-acetylglucosamine diphosphorylase/glucosamine-1-phosphate N-acetyltransferase
MDDLLSKVSALTSAGAGDREREQQPTALSQLAVWCRPMLQAVLAEALPSDMPINQPIASGTLLLNGRGWWQALPQTQSHDPAWVGTGRDGQVACVWADAGLAARLSPEVWLDEQATRALLASLPRRDVSSCVRLFDWPWELVDANESAIVADWTRHRPTADAIQGRIYEGSSLLSEDAIHIGAGSTIKPCVVIDAENGPVWIGRNVRVQPHCYIEGPVFIGDETLLQPGAVVHGRRSKVGGEIEASILHGFSNKQHNGFLGHSYLGSWVNIAADCINSDLKNTYGTIRVPINGTGVDSGTEFVGMFMGDHSKAGINVSFPTGAVVGFCCNVMTPRSPKFVPSFTWIDGQESRPYDLLSAIQVARRVMQRRQRELSPAQEQLFRVIRELSLTVESPTARLGAIPDERHGGILTGMPQSLAMFAEHSDEAVRLTLESLAVTRRCEPATVE